MDESWSSLSSWSLFSPCRAQDEQHSSEVSLFREELSEAHSKLQILQKQLDEELAKQPVTTQEVGYIYILYHILLALLLIAQQVHIAEQVK